LGKTGKDTELTFDSSILLIYPSYISVSVPVASFWEPPVSESQYRTFVWSYRRWSAAAVTAPFWTRRNGAQPLYTILLGILRVILGVEEPSFLPFCKATTTQQF
jgi:hypothetical protein